MAGSVEGTVVDDVTGIPLAGVQVDLLRGAAAAYSSTTDAQGRFSIEDVKAGNYTVRYALTNYLPPLGSTRALQVTGGPAKVEGRLTPIRKWSGRVVDGRGNPVLRARVELASLDRLVQTSLTNEEGRFELRPFPLLPGPFTISAVPPPGWRPPDPEPDSDRVLGWSRTYYPGVATSEAALEILPQPGLDVTALELKLLAVPTYALRGILLNPDATPAPNVKVTAGENRATPVASVQSQADGTFEFPHLVNGDWRLSAERESAGVSLRAVEWIEVAGRAPPEVKLQLNAPFELRGKVLIETPEGVTPPKPPQIRLEPVLRTHAPRLSDPPVSAKSSDDGNFRIPGLYPSAYRLTALSPNSYYLDSARLGEAPVVAEEIELSANSPPLTLTYKSNGGTVRGSVENCAARGVLLVPQDPSMRLPSFLRVAMCDAGDRFEVAAVRPGEYYLVFFSGFSPSWFSPRFDVNQAVKVTARAGEISSATLRATERPPF